MDRESQTGEQIRRQSDRQCTWLSSMRSAWVGDLMEPMLLEEAWWEGLLPSHPFMPAKDRGLRPRGWPRRTGEDAACGDCCCSCTHISKITPLTVATMRS